MLIAGITGQNNRSGTASLVSSFFSSWGKKISIVDYGDIIDLDAFRLKSYFYELAKNNTDILLLKISPDDSDRAILQKTHFDIMIYVDKSDDIKGVNIDSYIKKMHRLFSLLNRKGIAIVNADDAELLHFLDGRECCVVTFGFNPKASITASSTGDTVFNDTYMFCLQRSIVAINGTVIEPQEFRIKIDLMETGEYNLLAAAAFSIVYGLDLNALSCATAKS